MPDCDQGGRGGRDEAAVEDVVNARFVHVAIGLRAGHRFAGNNAHLSNDLTGHIFLYD